MKTWNIEALTGYKPLTTFYEDFSIADHFGRSAILDTYKRAMSEWKHDYKYLTELVMALNWKIWEHYDTGNEAYTALYNDLWSRAEEYASSHLEGEELNYYYRTID